MAEITIRISDRTLKITGTVLAGASLTWILFYLWSTGVFVPSYRLRVLTPEAAGLSVGAPVKLDGVSVGTVNAIRLAGAPAGPERRIELVLRIEKRYQETIRSDSTATLITEGLLGNRFVSIQRGFSGSVINPDGEIPFVLSESISFKQIIGSLAQKMDCQEKERDASKDKNQTPRKMSSKSRP